MSEWHKDLGVREGVDCRSSASKKFKQHNSEYGPRSTALNNAVHSLSAFWTTISWAWARQSEVSTESVSGSRSGVGSFKYWDALSMGFVSK